MQVLRLGSSGADVRRLQQALNRCMLVPGNRITSPPLARLQEDGQYGARTGAMVREFQRLNGVTVDGVVGPITSYLIFPFITFTTQLVGTGTIRGRRDGGGGQVALRLPVARRIRRVVPVRFGAAKAKDAPSGSDPKDDGGDDAEAITVDLSVGSGNGNSFKPWFVLKPSDDTEGPEAEGTISVDSTILRKKGFEFGGGLEFSRQLAGEGKTWKWAGSISGSYTNIKSNDGTFALSPIVDASVKEGLTLGTGVGLEASVNLLNDFLKLSVGGKVAAEVDPHEGSVQVGPAVSVGLKFKFEALRFGK